MTIARMMQMARAGVPAGGGGDVWTDPDIQNLSYDNISLDLGLGASGYTLRGLFFKPDGTRMYVSYDGVSGNPDLIKQYSMSSWDITTLSNDTDSDLNVGDLTSVPEGIYFKPDGFSLYMVSSSDDSVYRYDLSSPWDLNTASYASQSKSVASEEARPTGIYFKDDGTKMYIVGVSGDEVNEYVLGTDWDISTATFSNNFSVSSQTGFPTGIKFNPDGTRFYITTASATEDIYEYEMATAWGLSTASFNNVSYGDSVLTNPTRHAFKSDGSRVFFVDDRDTIYQYSTA